MIESLKKQYAPGNEEYGELCYYELLTHYKATDIYKVKYYVEHNHIGSCRFCDQVIKYTNSERKAKAHYVFLKAGKSHPTFQYAFFPERDLNAKDYEGAIKNFKANVLKAAYCAKYHKYVSLSNCSGGYTDGILHFIAVIIALVVSCFMAHKYCKIRIDTKLNDFLIIFNP